MTEDKQPERWAIVALMGHRKVAGRVSEELFAGTPMCRVDIPLADGTFSTRLFGGAALYEVMYVTEEVARAVAGHNPAHPIEVWSARSLGLLPSAERPEALTAVGIDRNVFLGDSEQDPFGDDEDDDEEAF